MSDQERGVSPVDEEPEVPDKPEDPLSGDESEDEGAPIVGRRVRIVALVALGVAALALVLGLATCQPPAEDKGAQGAATSQQQPEEDDLAARAEDAVAQLSFAGEDVSAAADTLEIVVADGHVWILETAVGNAAARVSLSAYRAAALAASLEGAEGVTWEALDSTGSATVAVTVSQGSGAATLSMEDGEGLPPVSDVLAGSDGWAIDDDTYSELGEDPGFEQSGGVTPVTPEGDPVVPVGEGSSSETDAETEETGPSEEDPEQVSPSEGEDSGESSEAGGSSDSSGSAGGTSSGTTDGDSASGGSDSGSAGSQPSHRHKWSPVYATRTVTDKEAWDETVTVKEAWDEPVYETVATYQCGFCGKKFASGTSDNLMDFTLHNDVEHNSEANFVTKDEQVQTGTIHHEAETKVVHHPAETHEETYVSGYRCSCGATRGV